MGDFNDEFKAAGETPRNTYIRNSGMYNVTISKVELSEIAKPDYKGNPFMQVTFVTEEGERSVASLYRPREGDDEEKAGFKLKKIRELFENAGIDMKIQGSEALKQLPGKKVRGLFKQVEYLGYNKDENNRPTIKTKIEYSFSIKIGETIEGNQSYFFTALSETNRTKYDMEFEKWERSNAANQQENTSQTSQATPSDAESDKLDPFSPDVPGASSIASAGQENGKGEDKSFV